jgi:hypothetical protein
VQLTLDTFRPGAARGGRIPSLVKIQEGGITNEYLSDEENEFFANHTRVLLLKPFHFVIL